VSAITGQDFVTLSSVHAASIGARGDAL
jgi:hypothetical protein